MPAFIIATVDITDAAAFGRYAKAIDGLAESFGGHYVVRGPVSETLEGRDTVGQRVVILEFPDGDAARAFYGSEIYQTAKAMRAGAATLDMRLVDLRQAGA